MSVRVGDSILVPTMAAPATPASGIEVYAKSDGRLYAKNASGNEYDLTGGPGATTISGVQTLLHMDATATSEIVNDVTESAARKTFTLPANDYDDIIVEYGVQQRVEQDATTRCDFTWRIKVGGTTERTYIERVIAMNTAGADSGNRSQSVLMHRFAGGQGSPTAITITSQHSLSNPATGSTVQWMRVYGVKDYEVGGGATNLDGLTDVVLTSPATDDVLKFNGTNWVNDTAPSGGGVQIDVIATSNASHAVPSGAKMARIQSWGGGGGGGAGRRSNTSPVSNRTGGAGGGAGGYQDIILDATVLPSTIAVTIGAGGTGAPAVTADTTNGGAGTSGGATTIVASGQHIAGAHGGGAGSGGDTGGSVSGGFAPFAAVGPLVVTQFTGGAGREVAGTASGAPYAPAPSSGGGGGGLDAVNTERAGGNGGQTRIPSFAGDALALSAGGVVNGNRNGANGLGNADSARMKPIGGVGGGGGASESDGVTAAGNGGNGGVPGGGGGGGGASVNGANSGKGGDGGNGMVVIFWYF